MKRIFQLICLLLAANCVAACSNTENDAPLGPIGETPAEEDPDAEHIYLWPEGNMPTETNYTVNNGNYQDDPDFRPNMIWYPVPDGTALDDSYVPDALDDVSADENGLHGSTVS